MILANILGPLLVSLLIFWIRGVSSTPFSSSQLDSPRALPQEASGASLVTRTGKGQELLILGLDSAGKSQIFHALTNKIPTAKDTTIGLNWPTKVWQHGFTTLRDIPGSSHHLSSWSKYLPDTIGILYVVDSSNRERVAEAREMFETILKSTNVPIAVFATKQYCPGCLAKGEVEENLGLASKRTHHWETFETEKPSIGNGPYAASYSQNLGFSGQSVFRLPHLTPLRKREENHNFEE
ncbi:hypothetical protein G7Y89_g11172 [Cudoniella acicularis]|uniref:Signal recognition particle receptor subunit beta n=1 Tax=Cudoniella acicularis TaxID=354080 RepID=A0A8H4RCV1_9HELO|nr:hypothetical protein G7Y89_g11172 [Cudoniella acicularis]